ncbi:ABC transporter permease subunit [Fictibacillus nanhaiensis]|uniref:ABC transporter permease subunit n=1 Tax=Fictibacillus nanhaiensis TaxID=742169 RepID=UPI001C97BCBC|nr:ABC transporter permease subunit [Fictibacillus nanhaiensis]MBY6036784.1 ABC transporter permease subunit [Fictibacillus nanhaiensis]
MIRSYKFWIGFSMIFGLILSSLIFSVLFDSHVRQVQILYDDHMEMIGAAPFQPSLMFPMGTDALGYDIAMKVLQGAKYTLFSVILIGFLRVLVSFMFAIPLAIYMPEKIRGNLEQLLSAFYFVPLTIVSVFILTPVLWEQLRMPGWEEYFIFPYYARVGIEIFVLTILVVPLLGSMIGNIIASSLKEDFIKGALVLGASRWRIFSKHVMPHVWPKLVIVFFQQCVQVLIIFIHLGYFKLFFGGTDVDYNPLIPDPPVSTTNEWSGLIGDYYNLIHINPGIALGPIIMFGVAIYSFQLMAEGLLQYLDSRNVNVKRNKKKNKLSSVLQEKSVSIGKFEFTERVKSEVK